MNLLFIHSGEKIKQDQKGNLYTDGCYTKEVWDRYFQISQNITAIFRKENGIYEEEQAQKSFQLFDKNKMKFVEFLDRKKSIQSYFNIKLIKQNRKTIKDAIKNSDLVIIRVPSDSGYLAVKYAKKLKKKYIVEVVGCGWDAYWNHSIKGKILAPYMYLLTRKCAKNAPFVTYVSEKFLQKRYPTTGQVLACSDVVLYDVKEENLKQRIDKIKNKNENEPIVLGTVAKIDLKYKGQQYVIKALAQLKKEGKNIEYHLVGGGNNAYLKKLAEKYNVQDKIKFCGELKHQQVFEFMKEIDIYIQPSNAESHGRVIIEALSTGCPAIGSSTGGIPELIQPEFIFKRKNVESLKSKIIYMLEQDLERVAKENYVRAGKFLKENLDLKRKDFYKKVKKEVENEKN